MAFSTQLLALLLLAFFLVPVHSSLLVIMTNTPRQGDAVLLGFFGKDVCLGQLNTIAVKLHSENTGNQLLEVIVIHTKSLRLSTNQCMTKLLSQQEAHFDDHFLNSILGVLHLDVVQVVYFNRRMICTVSGER